MSDLVNSQSDPDPQSSQSDPNPENSISGCTSLLEEDDYDQEWRPRRPEDHVELHRLGGYKLAVYSEVDTICQIKKQPDIGDLPFETRPSIKKVSKGLNVLCLCKSKLPLHHFYELSFPENSWDFSTKSHPGVTCVTVHKGLRPTLETRAARKFHKFFISPDDIRESQFWDKLPNSLIKEHISFTYRQKRLLSFNRRGQNIPACRFAFQTMKGHCEFLTKNDESINFEKDWYEKCLAVNHPSSIDWTLEYHDQNHKLFCKTRNTMDGVRYYCEKCQLYTNCPPSEPGAKRVRPFRRKSTEN